MTYQIIYSSESSIPMQSEALEALLAQAQRNNRANNISGALAYVDGCFLQILEGEMHSVKGLMDRIAGDLRHDALTILLEGEVSAAVFAEWDMAYVSATPQQVAQWIGFSSADQLPGRLRHMREDRQRVVHLKNCILSVLLGVGFPKFPE